MAEGRFISYLRVSTDRQGRSGLGLEAQRETVRQTLNGGDWELVAEFVEVESGTNKGDHRPELDKALARCRVMGAKLIVANVSWLTRNPDFMGRLASAGVDVWFCDLPRIEGPVGTFMLRQMLAVAELEAGFIGERTKKALAAKREWYARLTEEERAALRTEGKATQLGGDRGNLRAVGDKGRAISREVRIRKAAARATDLSPILAEIRASGATSLGQIARALNERGIRTPRGGQWQPVQVRRAMERAARAHSLPA